MLVEILKNKLLPTKSVQLVTNETKYCVIPGELNILDIAKDGRDMYAVRCHDAREYRHGLALLKAQKIEHIVVDTDPKRVRQLARAVSIIC